LEKEVSNQEVFEKMWKTILLCASLFGSAALGVTAATRWVEPNALPLAVAIGLTLVGIVLILAAPARARDEDAPLVPAQSRRSSIQHTAPRLPALDRAANVTPYAAASGPQPSLH
jgi:hypothetical protein